MSRASDAPIFDVEMERGVLGAVLLVGAPAIERLTVDVGLRPEHFYWRQHEHAYRAMLDLFDEGAAVDVRTVADRLRVAGTLDDVGGRAGVDALLAFAPAAGDVHTYGQCVVRDARWRARQSALTEAQAAVASGDELRYAQAEARLVAADGDDTNTWDEESTRTHLFDWLDGNDDEAILTPFPRVNKLLYGGLRRGDTSLLSGWTSMGKSITCDQWLEHAAAEHGLTAHLYMNEMSLMSRGLRTLASMSGVPFGRLLARELDNRDRERVRRALEAGFPFSMTNVAGWSAEDICRHMIARRWDIGALDAINGVPHDGTAGLDEVSGLLCGAAQRADMHLLVVAQLNRARADSGILPLPVERDVRESGKLVYDCANLFFVHRDQEEVTVPFSHGTVPTGEVRRLPSALFVVAKARNGELGKCVLSLDAERMRYSPELEIPEVAA